MKSTMKLLGIIAMITIIGFSMAGCPDTYTDNTISGTITANSSGEIIFGYTAEEAMVSDTCLIKTDLPEPDNVFLISKDKERKFSDLQESQVVKWEATIKIGALTWNFYENDSEVRLYGFMHE